MNIKRASVSHFKMKRNLHAVMRVEVEVEESENGRPQSQVYFIVIQICGLVMIFQQCQVELSFFSLHLSIVY
jgi:hypothetical protein